jgi:ribosome-associated heat shock protein Hsp15
VSNEARIDKWLWAVRVFKTRTLAANACRNGQVLIGEQRVKASREVRAGDLIAASAGGVRRTIKVLAFPPGRVGAKLVPQFMEDLTPPSGHEKAREAAALPQFMARGREGRPRKTAGFGKSSVPIERRPSARTEKASCSCVAHITARIGRQTRKI